MARRRERARPVPGHPPSRREGSYAGPVAPPRPSDAPAPWRPGATLSNGDLEQREIGPARHWQHQFDLDGTVGFADVAEEAQLTQRANQLGFDDCAEVGARVGVAVSRDSFERAIRGYRRDTTKPAPRLSTCQLRSTRTISIRRSSPPTVTSLTHSFGDNTRRKIYLYLRENPGATATELSRHCLVHANVVRHHLERLTEVGLRHLRQRPQDDRRPAREGLSRRGRQTRHGRLDASRRPARRAAGDGARAPRTRGRRGDGPRRRRRIRSHARPRPSVPTTPDPRLKTAMSSIAGLLTAHGFAARAEENDSNSPSSRTTAPSGLPPSTTRCSVRSTGDSSRACSTDSARNVAR